MGKTGIMICGNGSRSKSAEAEFGLLAERLKERYPYNPIEYGFLEYSAPNIHMGLNSLKNQGVNHIVAVPGMLFAATHAKNDIPSVLTTYQEKNPEISVSYGRELALHPEMIVAFEARILQSLGVDHIHHGRRRLGIRGCWRGTRHWVHRGRHHLRFDVGCHWALPGM